ncbi:MAG: adenylate kinase [Bacteroidales bacterium]|jgi:adenylate kinase|nr:adenylate kinase [Bacteroidales bacterium]
MTNFLIFGPPGSGKGTQSVKLAEEFRLIHLSTGDMLREEVAAATEMGKRVEDLMKRGELVPDEVVIQMIAERIDANPSAGGFIFDGFPRTVEQAAALDEVLEEKNTSISKMLMLEVEHDELVKRLLLRAETSGRPDDKKIDVIENRIKVYREKTEPVIDYYRKDNKYLPVNGMGDIDEIFDRLCKAVERSLK